MDYLIADDNENYGCSAVHMFSNSGDENYSIAENGVSYWITGLILNGELKIMKDTTEGETLTNLIKTKLGNARTHAYLDRLVVKTAPIADIKVEIENIKQDAFEEGQRDIQIKMQLLLGL